MYANLGVTRQHQRAHVFWSEVNNVINREIANVVFIWWRAVHPHHRFQLVFEYSRFSERRYRYMLWRCSLQQAQKVFMVSFFLLLLFFFYELYDSPTPSVYPYVTSIPAKVGDTALKLAVCLDVIRLSFDLLTVQGKVISELLSSVVESELEIVRYCSRTGKWFSKFRQGRGRFVRRCNFI